MIDLRYLQFVLTTIILFSACSAPKIARFPESTEDTLLSSDVLTRYMNTITSEELKDHLYKFASDDFEGRETATRGQKLAATYLADQYFLLDLKGPIKDQANEYFQIISILDENTSYGVLRTEKVQLHNGKDFITEYAGNKTTTNELVFVGYGMELPDYNDYTNLDLNGKAICAIWGNPRDDYGIPLFSTTQDSFLNIKNLSAKGITDLFITMPSQAQYDARIALFKRDARKFKPIFLLDESELADRPYNLYYISPSALAKLFGVSSTEYFKKIQTHLNNREPLGGIFYAKDLEIEVERPRKIITSENVIAYIEGSDLKHEVLILSSHYDHLGIVDGKIYNGADDDGSGTVGLLEIAEAFAKASKEGHKPRRTVVFINFTAEEKGLYGSEFYADQNPIFPLKNTVAVLNIDMIGRIDPVHEGNENYIYIIGADMLSKDLQKIHLKVSSTYFPEMEMDYSYNGKNHPDRIYYRSDHYNFAKHNIPVIFYFSGIHEDYHKHTDTPDKINYELLEKRTKLVFATAWYLANTNERPRVDVSDN